MEVEGICVGRKKSIMHAYQAYECRSYIVDLFSRTRLNDIKIVDTSLEINVQYSPSYGLCRILVYIILFLEA